jgi:hypothetical protein
MPKHAGMQKGAPSIHSLLGVAANNLLPVCGYFHRAPRNLSLLLSEPRPGDTTGQTLG